MGPYSYCGYSKTVSCLKWNLLVTSKSFNFIHYFISLNGSYNIGTYTHVVNQIVKLTNYIDPNSLGIFARNHHKSSKIKSTCSKKVPRLLDFDGIGTVANALAIHSPESKKSSRWSLMDLVHMATCSIHWAILWSTESIKSTRWSLVEFDGFGTHGYMLYSLGYTVEYWIHQNQAKPGSGFWWNLG